MQANAILSATFPDQPIDIKQICNMCQQAGQAILAIYSEDKHQVHFKNDGSPVTNADLASHEVIIQSLQKLTPNWPILSEEAADIAFSERSLWNTYWLVDPLDGTREFVNRTGQFTINIALIHQHKPIFGMVYIPLNDTFYFGGSIFQGAWRQLPNENPVKIKTSACNFGKHLTVAISRHMSKESMPALFKQLDAHFSEICIIESAGAIKGCMVADGSVDIYPRPGAICEWDTAAFQAIVEAAGGKVITAQGKLLEYNKKSSLLNGDFYVVGDITPKWDQLLSRMLTDIH